MKNFWKEQVAVCDEQVMEAYLEDEEIRQSADSENDPGRKLFPCYFGSALKLTGVKEFLEDLKIGRTGKHACGRSIWGEDL